MYILHRWPAETDCARTFPRSAPQIALTLALLRLFTLVRLRAMPDPGFVAMSSIDIVWKVLPAGADCENADFTVIDGAAALAAVQHWAVVQLAGALLQ
eukprot:353676-Chlamydomonas_euryale.AAC.3